MTEETVAAPGWADGRIDELFAALPQTPGITAARESYISCIAGRKAPAAPSDMLGAEFNGCRAALHQAFQAEGVDGWAVLDAQLEILEAEIASDS